MNNPGRRTSISHQGHLQQLLTKYFRDPDQALGLIDEFLRHERYDQAFCLRLIALAKQRGNDAAAALLTTTLKEERAADNKLTSIAERKVNLKAAS